MTWCLNRIARFYPYPQSKIILREKPPPVIYNAFSLLSKLFIFQVAGTHL
jgi:hypothetical protein